MQNSGWVWLSCEASNFWGGVWYLGGGACLWYLRVCNWYFGVVQLVFEGVYLAIEGVHMVFEGMKYENKRWSACWRTWLAG